MTEWKTVRVRRELLNAVERTLQTSKYKSLSEFVSEAIQLRLEIMRPGEKTTDTVECPIVHERLLCSPNHMWTMVTPEGNIRIGLSEYAQSHLKGIANIQIQPVGSEINKEKAFGTIETWMFKFDLHAPVSGKIVKINKILQNKPITINEDPSGEGWIAEIKPNDIVTLEEELRNLMSPKQYKLWAIRQKSFARTKS